MVSLKNLSYLLLVLHTMSRLSAQTLGFEPLNGPNGALSVKDIDSDHTGRLFLCQDDKIMKSVDDGFTWTNCMDGLDPYAVKNYFVKFLPTQSGPIFAHFRDTPALYKFQATTNSWTPVSVPWPYFMIEEFNTDPSGRIWAYTQYNQPIFYSSDSCATFQQLLIDDTINGFYKGSANYNDAHNLLLTSDALYHFDINGASQKIPENNFICSVHCNPYTGTTYYVDDSQNILKRSPDGGINWYNTALQSGSSSPCSGMYFASDGRTWAVSDIYVYHSEDDGISWETDTLLSYSIGSIHRMNNNSWIRSQFCGTQSLSITTDEGQTWTDISQQFKDPNIELIFHDAEGTLYAKSCGVSSVQKSTDSGLNWSNVQIMDGALQNVSNLAARPDGVMLATGMNYKHYRSFDNGHTWAPLGIIHPFVNPFIDDKFRVAPNGTFYFFSQGDGTYKSEDAGYSWQKISFPYYHNASYIAFYPNGDAIPFTWTSGIVYIAETNASIALPWLSNSSKWVLAAHCTNNGTAYLYIDDYMQEIKGLYRILPNSDYTLEALSVFNTGPGIKAICSNQEGHVFAATQTTLYKSTDEGLSWEIVADLPQDGYLNTLYVSPDQYLYAGYWGDVIYRSTVPVGTLSSTAEDSALARIHAYPNPFSNWIRFDIEGPDTESPQTLRLFDPLGRTLRRVEFNGTSCTLPRAGLPSGLIFYSIESKGRIIGSGKVTAE